MVLAQAGALPMLDSAPPNDREGFIAWLVPRAQRMQKRLGIPASAAIAQAILESDNGSSHIARNAKNLFGMSATGTGYGNPFWDGEKVYRADRYWRKYRRYQDSIDDYGHLFYRVSAYHRALAHLDDPRQFLALIVPTYAPSSDGNVGYLNSVLRLIEQHNLTQYDVPREQWALDPNLTRGLVRA